MESKTKTETQFITKEMTIGDVIAKYPFTAEIMTSYGLHCVGCGVNPYETIEQGCLGHGMEEDTLDRMMDELNESISNAPKEEIKFTITKKAAEKLKEFAKQEGKDNFSLRLGASAGGCCGGDEMNYTLEFADKSESYETILDSNGINLFVDSHMVNKMNDISIDFVEDSNGSGFKIETSVKKSGGCGSGCGCSH